MNVRKKLTILQEWVVENDPLKFRSRWLIYMVVVCVAGILFMVGSIPYLNLVLSPAIIIFFFLLSIIFLFAVPNTVVVVGILVLLLISMVAGILGKDDSSELIGTIVYFLLWVTGVRLMRDKQ